MSHGKREQRDGFVRNVSPAGKPAAHVRLGEGLHDFFFAFGAFALDELRQLSHGQNRNGTRATGDFAFDLDALCAARSELRQLS